MAFEGDFAEDAVGGEFGAEEGCHGGLEGGAEEDFVEAEEAFWGGGEAVVVGHGEHEAAGVGVAVEEGEGWHWEAVLMC